LELISASSFSKITRIAQPAVEGGGDQFFYSTAVLLPVLLVTVFVYLKRTSQEESSRSDDCSNNTMRKSFFGFFYGESPAPAPRASITGNAAKEEAARLTREADIRRLYEAGTQQEVLEQLYKPEEVLKVIEKIDKERVLLELLEKEAAQSTPEKGQEKPIKETECEEEKDAAPEEEKDATPEEEKDAAPEDELATRDQKKKFTLRFEHSESEAQIQTKVETLEDEKADKSPDDSGSQEISFDDVNLLGSDDGQDDQDVFQEEDPATLENEPEDDLLKELMDGSMKELMDGSSQYFDKDSAAGSEQDAAPEASESEVFHETEAPLNDESMAVHNLSDHLLASMEHSNVQSTLTLDTLSSHGDENEEQGANDSEVRGKGDDHTPEIGAGDRGQEEVKDGLSSSAEQEQEQGETAVDNHLPVSSSAQHKTDVHTITKEKEEETEAITPIVDEKLTLGKENAQSPEADEGKSDSTHDKEAEVENTEASRVVKTPLREEAKEKAASGEPTRTEQSGAEGGDEPAVMEDAMEEEFIEELEQHGAVSVVESVEDAMEEDENMETISVEDDEELPEQSAEEGDLMMTGEFGFRFNTLLLNDKKFTSQDTLNCSRRGRGDSHGRS
jgi:hypothetical protein